MEDGGLSEECSVRFFGFLCGRRDEEILWLRGGSGSGRWFGAVVRFAIL